MPIEAPIQALSLATALAAFDDLWSPRIVARVNDYEVRVAKVAGEHIWHSHPDTDEFFLVLDGRFVVSLRQDGTERDVVLETGDTVVVPHGVEHRPYSDAGAAVLMFEPSGTLSTGNHEGDVPEHIDSTTGRDL